MSSLERPSPSSRPSMYRSNSHKLWPQVHRTKISDDVDTTECKYVTKSSQLGDGHFSVVKECRNTYTNETYAMKLVHKHLLRDKVQLIQREVYLLKEMSNTIRELEMSSSSSSSGSGANNVFQGHHHVLQLFDFFETSENIVLVTQLCQKGDLYERIIEAGSLDLASQVIPYTACLVSVLDFLHSHGIVHRDLKAENVLFRQLLIEKGDSSQAPYDLDSHDLILADFGLATKINSSTSSTALKEYVGTISYIAPEIVHCKSISTMSPDEISKIQPYSTGVDIWALGVLAYFMNFGYMPFDCDTDDETLDCILTQDYYIDENYKDDPSLKEFWAFLKVCFTVDMSRRPSAQNLQQHNFIKQFFPGNENELLEPFEMEARPTLTKTRSSSSVHSLKSPARSDSATSLASLHAKYSTSIPSHKSATDLKHMDGRISTRESSLKKMRDTLKKTLSMTSMKPQFTTTQTSGTNDLQKNSTFTLDPKPPKHTLMNGCFSTTPESASDFNVTPNSLSRKSSTSSILPVTNETTDEEMALLDGFPFSGTKNGRPIFKIGDYEVNG